MSMNDKSQTSFDKGLTSSEVALRLTQFGLNEIPIGEQQSLWLVIIDVMREPMFLMLITAAIIYSLLGEIEESLLVSFFALLSIGLVIIQQNRSERALQSLKALSAPTARVLRDGHEQKIAASTLVPGDILLVDEGERIAADGAVRRTQMLQVDESVLTGESLPVRKIANDNISDFSAAIPGGDDLPFVYSGTLVVSGHAIIEVLVTGSSTRAGDIGQSLASIKGEDTHLQTNVTKIIRFFGILAIMISSSLVLFYGAFTGDWLKAALSGIALAMAMMPEEFPVVLVIFLALGALRLSQVNVLVRRSSAIEALGSATVLCVDKTGTLTRNEMRLRYVSAGSEHINLTSDKNWSDAIKQTLFIAQYASSTQSVDPLDRAIHTVLNNAGEKNNEHQKLVREFGLTPELLAVTTVWQLNTGQHLAAAKGAPEAIFGLCHTTAQERSIIEAEIQDLAERGLRVLAVAVAKNETFSSSSTPHGFDFTYLGLLAFEDPLRDTVQDAVRIAHDAGIAVAMITGDYPATARAIAHQAGIDGTSDTLTGSQITLMNDATLQEQVKKTRIFARIQPNQKLRIVTAFAANGEIVAMTGDGVNDAPALKAAHIGIAIGPRSTDVAREASDLVLLKEDFGLIVTSIKLGRRIFDNLRKVMIYITAIHVPIAGLALLPIIFGFQPVMLPVHVILTEMIIDPVCSLAFENEAEEDNIMNRPPRKANDDLIGPL